MPGQTVVGGVTVAAAEFTVMVVEAVLVHPALLETSTVYVVVAVGVTLIVAVVEPLLHE